MPTIGIRDLIEIKKTQRLADYPVISALTIRLLEEEEPSSGTLAWAGENLFTLEAFLAFNETYPAWVAVAPAEVPRELTKIPGHRADEIAPQVLSIANQWMAESMGRLQMADRTYWRGIIAQLRDLRTAGKLVSEGTSV